MKTKGREVEEPGREDRGRTAPSHVIGSTLSESLSEYHGEDTGVLKHEEQDSTRQVNKHLLYKSYHDNQLSTQN